jgi:hypothetical protein
MDFGLRRNDGVFSAIAKTPSPFDRRDPVRSAILGEVFSAS